MSAIFAIGESNGDYVLGGYEEISFSREMVEIRCGLRGFVVSPDYL
jgi:hypothetical protein